jgi:hypothetical protein
MPKKAPTTPIKPLKARGWLVCDDCHVTAEFHSLGDPVKDGGWPLHRCGYDIRPFARWVENDPRRNPITYTPEGNT